MEETKMKKNILCVSGNRDTVNVGFYEVEFNDSIIKEIKFAYYNETKETNVNNQTDEISELCKATETDIIIIDCRSSGIAISDILEKDSTFEATIFKEYITQLRMSEGLIKINTYNYDNKLIIGNVKIDLSKFILNNTANGVVRLESSSYDSVFSNLALLFANIDTCTINSEKNKKRKLIENNLQEIVEVLVEDLFNINKSNYKRVNELVRLIDKVNYIRGQY